MATIQWLATRRFSFQISSRFMSLIHFADSLINHFRFVCEFVSPLGFQTLVDSKLVIRSNFQSRHFDRRIRWRALSKNQSILI